MTKAECMITKIIRRLDIFADNFAHGVGELFGGLMTFAALAAWMLPFGFLLFMFWRMSTLITL